MGDFFTFLAQKSMAYHHIDTQRMGRVWREVEHLFPSLPKIIHLVGTNGKGTTGRFIANGLLSQGKNVGHYTSPHIVEFNERIWLNGKNVTYDQLQEAHTILMQRLTSSHQQELSYFEYTTLLAIVVYASCEWVVLEAGLGGEYDATTVFPHKELLVVTPIGIDHADFLGESIEKIATTKLYAMQSTTLVGFQTENVVDEIAHKVGKERGYDVCSVTDEIFTGIVSDVTQWGKTHGVAPFLVENAITAMSAMRLLGFDLRSDDLKNDLAGRFQKLSPYCVVDVGHNELAASVVAAQIPSFFSTPPVLVYNCFSDKEPVKILGHFIPYIKVICVLPLVHERLIDQHELFEAIETLGLCTLPYEDLESDTNVCVFGSFSVVEEYLKKGDNAR